MTAFLIFATLVLNAIAFLYFREYFYRKGFKAGHQKCDDWWISVESAVEKTQQEIWREGKC